MDEVKVQVDDLNHKAEQAAERYNAATDELAEIQRRLASAESNVERQEAKVAELAADMGGFAAASYRAGGIDPTLSALMASDPGDFLARASVVDAFANQQADQLATVAAERRRLEQDRLLADEELRPAHGGRGRARRADGHGREAPARRPRGCSTASRPSNGRPWRPSRPNAPGRQRPNGQAVVAATRATYHRMCPRPGARKSRSTSRSPS